MPSCRPMGEDRKPIGKEADIQKDRQKR